MEGSFYILALLKWLPAWWLYSATSLLGRVSCQVEWGWDDWVHRIVRLNGEDFVVVASLAEASFTLFQVIAFSGLMEAMVLK